MLLAKAPAHRLVACAFPMCRWGPRACVCGYGVTWGPWGHPDTGVQLGLGPLRRLPYWKLGVLAA